MMTLKFSPDYKSWRKQFDTELVYTRRDMAEALEKQARELVVNRVIRSFDGTWNGEVLQILAVHKTPEGCLVIVR